MDHETAGVRLKCVGRLGLLVATLLLIVAIDVPWDLQDHTHWAKVGWLPFWSPPVRFLDIVANVLLGVPVGIAAVVNRLRPRTAAGLALLASLTGETLQLYSHTRFPSATDVVCNVGGALLATRFAARRPPS